MGTAGCIIPPAGYLAKVRQICDRYGVLLIADEVVCGFGRTGRWFGVEHSDVVPDLMVVAGSDERLRADGGGRREAEIANRIPVFFDVHTYGGHPVSAAAALANIGIIEREGLVNNSATVEAYMLELLEGLRAHPAVGDVRGLGLFMAVELRDPLGTRTSHPTFTSPIRSPRRRCRWDCSDRGRWVAAPSCSPPPLVFTKAQAERAVEVLDTALSKVEARILPTVVA